jgi:cytochrome c oxidase subunit 3
MLYADRVRVLALGMGATLLTSYQWWRDIRREASLQGYHTPAVEWNIRWGIALFIVSEVLFFFSFFWAYFHMRLSPVLELGLKWPPQGVVVFNPFRIPLLNTTILLRSGLTVTWAHHAILESRFQERVLALALTISLGIYFTAIQLIEYLESPFTFCDSVYGSCFFMATGFHGLHVIIGALFLLTGLLRLTKGHFSRAHHFGFEAAAWYWHFVDVVWIFLFVRIYWWGRCIA